MTIDFGIITPTYNRLTLLRRHLRQVSRQTYRHWRLLVIHDGPSPVNRTLVESFQTNDSRISYFETEISANDSGVTPRLEGALRLVTACRPPDYVVFWDDDNDYAYDALERIARALERSNRPDLLIARVKYGLEVIPPPNASIRSLKVGEVDTACLIFRPTLARDAYASVQQHSMNQRDEVLRFNDFLAYRYVSQLVPPRSIRDDLSSAPICCHDGLRWGPFIRRILRIPPLGLARMIGLGR